jgi:nucleotide-binding universal stress UspA family protein
MTSLHHILAASDFSTGAGDAVSRASKIASLTGAQLDLIHVINQPALAQLCNLIGRGGAAAKAKLIDDARHELRKLATRLGKKEGIKIDYSAVTGNVVTTLLEKADARDSQLIVLGEHGQGSALHPLLLGSTSERLLRHSRRPILIVKKAPQQAYRRVLVPLDFSAWSAPTLQLARHVAPDAEIILLHAFEAPFEGKLRYAGVDEETIERYQANTRIEALHRLHDLATAAGLDTNPALLHVAHGDISRTILDEEEHRDCDLIVMGKHGQAILEDLLLGSVTKQILAQSHADILVAAGAGGPA